MNNHTGDCQSLQVIYQELGHLRQRLESFEHEKKRLEILLETAIEHGDLVEGELLAALDDIGQQLLGLD